MSNNVFFLFSTIYHPFLFHHMAGYDLLIPCYTSSLITIINESQKYLIYQHPSFNAWYIPEQTLDCLINLTVFD